jgi:CBS domain-containing protein
LKLVEDLLDHKGTEVISITPGATVADAVKLMAEKGIGSLLVMQEGKLYGIVTERDYARKVIVGGRSTEDTCIADIMTPDVLTTELDRSVDECMTLMTEKRIRHLPVVDGERVLGLISIGDLMKAIVTDHQNEVRALDR